MKPEFTLTQLEEEPETGFFGLTFTEVKGIFIKCFIVIVVVAIALSFFIQFGFAMIIGMGCSALYFWRTVKKTGSNRADKPLYYPRHLKLYKNPRLFIHPKKQYQRERTNYGRTQK